MQKSLSGQRSHQEVVSIPIFDNDQDIPRLAAQVAAYANGRRWRTVFWCAATVCTAGGGRCRKRAAILKGWSFYSSVSCNVVYWRRNDSRDCYRY
ncbi:methylthioribulose-1-phosphate dehydratase [Serratia rubidaea]|uniref:Methylthioribulose-1-phosphate dehydratase n=1 Tax=Serratia rubidaea TaxID=61652 RepID=A0A447QPT9_SERRU|nr:methylthioribulose-1-phosphate dehydratase [Serratia rubidaea]